MVNLAVFLFTTSDTRGRENHQNLGGLGLLQVMFRNPGRQFFHQLLLQQARVIDLLRDAAYRRLASSGVKPSSRKRFAPGFVTWRISVSISFLFLPHADHGAIASRGNCPVLLAGHLSLLLEAMQDVDGFLEFGDVHHAIDFGPSPPGSPLPAGVFWECQISLAPQEP